MMDDLRLAAVAARVVAWHNRHPLARRISAAHVHAVGYVGLPFVGAPGVAAPARAAPPADAAAGEADMVDLTALEAGAPEAGSLRERALARARQQAAAPDAPLPVTTPQGAAAAPAQPGVADAPLPSLASLQPDFSEDFIDPLPVRAVARFAARAGQVLARPPEDGPLRQVVADGAHPGRLPARVYLLTAVIETGTRKSRVLLGGGLGAPVLGRRIFDGPRLALLGGLVALVVGVPVWLLQPEDDATPATQAAASVASAPASAASEAAVVAAAPEAASASASASSTAAAAAASSIDGTAETTTTASPAATAGVAASAPPVEAPPHARAAEAVKTLRPAVTAASSATPHLADGVSIRPVISDADKALARQARQAREAAATAPAARSPEPLPAAPALPQPHAPKLAGKPEPEPATPPHAAPAVASSQPAANAAAFALSTRALRTRAEAEQVQVAMRSLLRTVGAGELRVDVLPQGDDWRVVALPFTQRAAADKARALLVSRGMRVEVVDF